MTTGVIMASKIKTCLDTVIYKDIAFILHFSLSKGETIFFKGGRTRIKKFPFFFIIIWTFYYHPMSYNFKNHKCSNFSDKTLGYTILDKIWSYPPSSFFIMVSHSVIDYLRYSWTTITWFTTTDQNNIGTLWFSIKAAKVSRQYSPRHLHILLNYTWHLQLRNKIILGKCTALNKYTLKSKISIKHYHYIPSANTLQIFI